MEATECVGACEARTVVLVGKVGNGKSATGNSILGERAFLSRPSPVGVTGFSHLQTTVVDGQNLNVIDTPGLFDYSRKPEMIRNEILKCFKMAKDGIHVVLVVLSVRTRYSVEEKHAFADLLEIFGGKISDYMIVIFTGGDDLDENDETLDDYLGRNCPEPFKEILEICGSRRVLFENKTTDCCKKSEQVKQLLMLVNGVVEKNGGKPYKDELLLQQLKIDQKMNKATVELEQQLSKEKASRLEAETAAKVAMNKVTVELEQQLSKEKAARLEAERAAKVALLKSKEHARQLRENLARAHREAEKLRNKGGSVIHETLASAHKEAVETVASVHKEAVGTLASAHKEAEKLRHIALNGGSAVMKNLAQVHKGADECIKAQVQGCAIM